MRGVRCCHCYSLQRETFTRAWPISRNCFTCSQTHEPLPDNDNYMGGAGRGVAAEERQEKHNFLLLRDEGSSVPVSFRLWGDILHDTKQNIVNYRRVISGLSMSLLSDSKGKWVWFLGKRMWGCRGLAQGHLNSSILSPLQRANGHFVFYLQWNMTLWIYINVWDGN